MAIPFTQYMRPLGRPKQISINRPDDIEALAFQFIEAGGTYEAEVLITAEVSLTACMTVDDEPQDVEIEVVPNGPSVTEAIDRLVRASVKHIEETPQ